MADIKDYEFDHVICYLHPAKGERQVAVGMHKTQGHGAQFEIPEFWLGAIDEAKRLGVQEGKRQVREALGIIDR